MHSSLQQLHIAETSADCSSRLLSAGGPDRLSVGHKTAVTLHLTSQCCCQVILVDPQGSALYNKVTRGVMFAAEEAESTRLRNPCDTITEGLGVNRITANFREVRSTPPCWVHAHRASGRCDCRLLHFLHSWCPRHLKHAVVASPQS